MADFSTRGPRWTPDSPDVPSRLQGRKTGRTAPREHLRPPKREQVLESHGLLSSGDVDTQQGQLFDTSPYTLSLDELAQSRDLPAPKASSTGGFMPQIEASPTGRSSAAQKKVTAIRNYTAILRDESGDPAAGLHTAYDRTGEALASHPGDHADWYMSLGTDPETGKRTVSEGKETHLINNLAWGENRDPVAVTRAVADLSPRNRWSKGDPDNLSYPNLSDVRNVSRFSREHLHESEIPAPDDLGSRAASQRIGRVINSTPPGLSGLPMGAAKAIRSISGEYNTEPVEVADPELSQKIGNFNESLLSGRSDVPNALKAGYAGSYTSDVWDQRGQGFKEYHDGGPYSVAAMVGSRAALKAGRLPSEAQSAVWEVTRDMQEGQPLGGLLREDKNGNLSARQFKN